MKPFLMASGDQFLAPPPPALTSAEYAAAFAEVKAIGSAGSLLRTADQSAAAKFWEGSGGMTWLQIATELAADEGMSTLEYSRMFASLGTGLADSFISGFDTKYEYDFWRPVTAIRGADLDGNPDTDADAGWTSFITAPSHPSYLSTHSITDGVAAGILLPTCRTRRSAPRSGRSAAASTAFRTHRSTAPSAVCGVAFTSSSTVRPA